MIRYTPDTCDCIIEYDAANVTFTNWIQKCFLHKDLNNQALQDAVFAHNNGYQQVPNPTDPQIVQNALDKRTEKIRVKALGPVTKNTS